MKKLVIEVEVENEAMEHPQGLASVLDDVSREIYRENEEHDFIALNIAHKLSDDNGNTVGFWKVVYGKAVVE